MNSLVQNIMERFCFKSTFFSKFCKYEKVKIIVIFSIECVIKSKNVLTAKVFILQNLFYFSIIPCPLLSQKFLVINANVRLNDLLTDSYTPFCILLCMNANKFMNN